MIEAGPLPFPYHSFHHCLACRGGPDHFPVTDNSVFCDGDDTQSLVNALDSDPTSPLNAPCPSDPTDVSYGVRMWNCFICLPVEPIPLMIVLILLLYLTVLISALGIPPFVQVQPLFPMIFTLLFLPFPELSAAIPSLISMQFPLPLWMDSHCCPLLYCLHLLPAWMSVRLHVVPPDSLKDLTCFTFNNLSSCNIHSMAASFSDSVMDIYLPWVALDLVEQVSIKPNLHSLYLDSLDHLVDSSLIGLTLQETYNRHISLALHGGFDKTSTIVKNLDSWHCRLLERASLFIFLLKICLCQIYTL